MTTQEETSPSSHFSDRLATARRRFFVGRATELELFRQTLQAEETPFVVLYLFGPGGVGKTTLLSEYARLAAEQGRSVYRLDGRDVDPSPQGFFLALSQAINPQAPPLSLKTLANLPPAVLLLDTYERLTALDGWLRETFLPALPAHWLVVIAGRQPPSEPWRSDPAWRKLARVVSLRNLRPEESRQLLTTLQVPLSLQEIVLDLTLRSSSGPGPAGRLAGIGCNNDGRNPPGACPRCNPPLGGTLHARRANSLPSSSAGILCPGAGDHRSPVGRSAGRRGRAYLLCLAAGPVLHRKRAGWLNSMKG